MKFHMHLALVALLVAIGGVPCSHAAETDTQTLVKSLDTDSDGTLSLDEVTKQAAIHFDALDADHDGTLDKMEIAGSRVSSGTLTKFDPDKDSTLDKTEYLALVKARFAAADTDHDGTLTPAELKSKQGKALVALIQ